MDKIIKEKSTISYKIGRVFGLLIWMVVILLAMMLASMSISLVIKLLDFAFGLGWNVLP